MESATSNDNYTIFSLVVEGRTRRTSSFFLCPPNGSQG